MLDKEILDGFKEETNQLLEELENVVEALEDADQGTFPADKLSEFAQKIDRIMGAAKTMAEMDESMKPLSIVGNLAEICKRTGYQAARTKVPALVPLFAAFWADVIELIGEATAHVDNPEKIKPLTASFGPVLEKRLKWLAERVSKVAGDSAVTMLSQAELDKLMENG